MKKILLCMLLFSLGFNAFTQEIGIRFGDISGGSVAIDGVLATTKYTRLHADVSFGNGVGLDVLWDFLYKPIGGEAFNWYVGAGPYAWFHDPFYLGVAGELGLEYRFNKVPIAIGADWRPTLSIIESTDFYADKFGLNVRWIFGKK
ncbi:MAG: hypothetical protein U0W24_13985 [Bacteroidales bacterium]